MVFYLIVSEDVSVGEQRIGYGKIKVFVNRLDYEVGIVEEIRVIYNHLKMVDFVEIPEITSKIIIVSGHRDPVVGVNHGSIAITVAYLIV